MQKLFTFFLAIQAIQEEFLEAITNDPSQITHKLLRDGQILIQKENKTFTLEGKPYFDFQIK